MNVKSVLSQPLRAYYQQLLSSEQNFDEVLSAILLWKKEEEKLGIPEGLVPNNI